tara:strand:+ start:3257 stop:4087 length:831 start_codon:yes stop_codon:yes gene_type:complete
MTFIKGFKIKPKIIDKTGVVTFTDGTNNDIIPNQLQCEAYGYTYDQESRTCKAFSFSQNLEKNISNTNNKINGSRNVTELGTNNTFIMGEKNIVKGYARNNIIVGSNNEIENSVNNATVLGNYGIAQRDGEVVFGGGAFNGAGKGFGQSSVVSLSGTTTDATQTNLKVNNSSSNTIIARSSTSSFQGFEANVLGVRTGGSSGSGAVNDRIFLRATGIIYLKAANQSVATLGSSGTVTGWTTAVAFSSTNDMHLSVTGATNMNISWSATLNLYEIIV